MPRSTGPPPTAPRSACPASPGPPRWTAPSSTGTGTSSRRSTPFEAGPPPAGGGPGPAVTRASLQADLLAAHERAVRLNARVRQLEKRLSEALGEQAWRESGLAAPADIDALNQKISQMGQQIIDLRLQLEEQGEDLAAARAANRELMAQLNTTAKHR